MKKFKISALFTLCAAICLSPVWLSFVRMNTLPALVLSGVAVLLLLLSLSLQHPLRSILFWIGPLLGWVVAVNAENGNGLDWAVMWVVATAGAYGARIALASLSWHYSKNRRPE